MSSIVIKVSPRERDVLNELLKDGADNLTIALRLSITRDTVKCHFRHAMKVTGMNRTALALAMARGEVVVQVVEPRLTPPKQAEARLDLLTATPPAGLQGPRLHRRYASLAR